MAFTGSTAVGRRIQALAAETIKRVTLELGGKSASVVFADANLERAAHSGTAAMFGESAGQDCCARSRILVEASAMDRFMEALEEAVERVVVGDPLDEATEMGPLVSESQRETVASFMNGDAPVAIRGSAPEGKGYWFPPTVLAPMTNDARAAPREIFGPVACVIPFRDEAEAIGSPTTRSTGYRARSGRATVQKAFRVARAIDTGVLSINSNSSVRVTTPFGFKQSGFGRELGPHALDHYTELKNVYYATEGS